MSDSVESQDAESLSGTDVSRPSISVLMLRAVILCLFATPACLLLMYAVAGPLGGMAIIAATGAISVLAWLLLVVLTGGFATLFWSRSQLRRCYDRCIARTPGLTI